MIRVTVKQEDETDKVIGISVKEQIREDFFDKMEEMKKSLDNKEDELGKTREFFKFENDIAIKCCNISSEEFHALPLEEQSKITKAVRKIIFPNVGGDPANFF